MRRLAPSVTRRTHGPLAGRGLAFAASLCLVAAGGCFPDLISAADGPPNHALLSAYFGLDDAMPFAANGLCRGAAGQDGMPVIFATEVEPATVRADAFAVVSESGEARTPVCATLRPAVDPGELRTVLLIGEFGDAGADPPALVEVVGDIVAADGTGRSYLGATVPVTPLAAGPTMVFAEPVPPDQWALDRRSGPQRGDGCPAEGTRQIVRATWAGGVTNQSGDDPDAAEQALYEVTLRLPNGDERTVSPIAVADLGDGDNNHLLCLDVAGEPLAVAYPAGHLYDPNHDAPNPATRVAAGAGSAGATPVASAES